MKARALLAAACLAWGVAQAQPFARATPVEPVFFGLSIHGAHLSTAWPGVPFGAWRLWDTRVKWSDIEPQAGQFKWDAFDSQVDLATRHGVKAYYGLGQTPPWASTRPDEKFAYGLGTGAMPKSMDDWRRYVDAVSKRYKGRLDAYEVWNEPKVADASGHCGGTVFFCGSAQDLVALGKVAHEVIRRNDPAALLTSPSYTGGLPGVRQLDDYLAAGGAAFTDVISFHFYELNPESAWTTIAELRKVMRKHGIERLPIWNTEVGYLVQNQESTLKPQYSAGAFSVVYSPEEAAARMARVHLVAAAGGVDRVNWYAWDNRQMGMIGTLDQKPHAVARAYAVVYGWLVGATLSCAADDSFGAWRCDLARKGRRASVYWDKEVHAPAPVRMPGYGPRLAETLLSGAQTVQGGASLNWDGAPVLVTEDGRPWGQP